MNTNSQHVDVLMPFDPNLLEQLLHEEEGAALDFKRDQYLFKEADDRAKSELLKDILAFTNAWRQTTAYVLIGVEEVRGGRSKIVGVTTHLADADLQQFVNSKTQQPVEISYRPFRTQNVEIGVIEIPVQKRPVYLTTSFGKLEADKVYLRRSSSTAVATPEEIARMGEMGVLGGTPQLVLEWADLEQHSVLPSPCKVRSLILEPKLPDNTFEEPRPLLPWNWNENYSREIVVYTFAMAFLKPLGLRLHNQGGVVGKRVRFVGSVTRGADVRVVDWSDRPMRPYRNSMEGLHQSIVPLASRLQNNPEPCVQAYADSWEITINFGDIRPRDEVWTTSSLLIGSSKSGCTKLQGELRGDNLPEPISCALAICFEVKQRAMRIEDINQYLDAT